MSKETREWLSEYVLVGNTDERGNAWHWKLGDNNHFAGAIPTGVVMTRLFNWQAEKKDTYILIPTDSIEDCVTTDENGVMQKLHKVPNFVAVTRMDNYEVFGMPSPDYRIHPFAETLINLTAELTDGNDLGISSAGLLDGGRKAWVELSLPATIHDETTGFSFRPNLLAASSLDQSIATSFSRTCTATVCDNTLSAALGEKGMKVTKKHSKHSELDVKTVKRALSLVDETAEQMTEQLHWLASLNVTDGQFFDVLDILMPIPEDDKATQRGITRISNKRDDIVDMWHNDKRCADWVNTGLGVIQTLNTYQHHKAEIRGAGRIERNAERGVTGKIEAVDMASFSALAKVLELTPA